MDFYDVVERRHSVRLYQAREIEPEKLQRILQAANRAPSAGNKQAYEIVLVRDPKRKWRLCEACLDQRFITEAPVALVFLASPERNRARYGHRGAHLYALQDATVACAYAQLAATAEGLDTCWVGAFDDDAVAAAVEAPRAMRPVAVLPVGYAAEQAVPTPRRPLDDLVHNETVRR
ncbi:MAG: nitroreductase family protein [Verrucomicrobiae bacterium]|nr:nitroreductase family protein [Verrucomicrobiae bacterium]